MHTQFVFLMLLCLFLLAACTPQDEAELKAIAEQARQTAVAGGKEYLSTEAPKVKETALDGSGYGGVCHWGYSGGWSDQSLDLTALAGEPNVWIAFGFYSNGTEDRLVGAYIDDVVVRKCVETSCPAASAQSQSIRNTFFSAPVQRELAP